MIIKYKCKYMKAEIELTVPDRFPTGDLGEWLNGVQYLVGIDHRARSPLCVSGKMDYLKIPRPGDERTPIGAKQVLDS